MVLSKLRTLQSQLLLFVRAPLSIDFTSQSSLLRHGLPPAWLAYALASKPLNPRNDWHLSIFHDSRALRVILSRRFHPALRQCFACV